MKEVPEEQMKIIYNLNKILIEIPVALLIYAQENNPDNPCKIIDRYKMLKYFKDRFLGFGEDDSKGSDFECLLDKFFADATEYGEYWIEFTPDRFEGSN